MSHNGRLHSTPDSLFLSPTPFPHPPAGASGHPGAPAGGGTAAAGPEAVPPDGRSRVRPPAGPGSRRRHEVPTHLDVQDRLFLGLSPRQVTYLLLGLVGGLGLWSQWPQLPDVVRLGLALSSVAAGAALALVRWGGHGLEGWAAAGLRYAARTRRAVWRRGGAPLPPSAPAATATTGRPLRRAHGPHGVPPAGAGAASAQSAFVGVEDIAGETLHLSGGRTRAVLEIAGVDVALRRADEQEALVTAFAACLNGLTFPIQVLVRVQPVDLEPYLGQLERHAGRLPHRLAVLAHDHTTFLRRLAGRRALLERRCYVVVPADDAPAERERPAAPAWRRFWPGPFGPASGREGAGPNAYAEAVAAGIAARRLAARCAEVSRGLARAGLAARRMGTEDLARLLYAAWCPDLAGAQRLRQRVADGTVPVVGAPRPASGPAAPGRAAGPDAGSDPSATHDPGGPQSAAGAAGQGGDEDPARARWRFERGARCVADLIAPAAVEIARDHVRIDRHYLRTLAITGYPRTVSPGWLAPLLYAAEPLEISLHVQPLPSGEMVKALSHRLVQLHSSRLLDARGGRLADPEREVAYDDVERLRDALQRGEERVFATSLYLLLRAPSAERLDELTRRTEAVLDGMLAHSRVPLLQQEGGLRAALPLGEDGLLLYRNLDTSSLATTFPFSANAPVMERGVFYGVARHGHAPVVVDPFDASLENANTAVIATSGAGKSYSAKLLALRQHLLGVDVLVVDPEDEYRRLCAAVGGQYVRLSATARERLNPFDLPQPPGPPAAPGAAGRPDEPNEPGEPGEPNEPGEDVLAEQVLALVALVEMLVATPETPLTAQERTALDEALYATYDRAGISADRSTHGRPAPLLRDLYAVLKDAGPRDTVAAGLAGRLHRYVHGSLAGLFAGPTNVALDRPFVVFSIQRLEPELRPLAIHLITAFVWGQVRRARRPRLLVVDEAWSVLQYREGGAFLAGLARRARKYYLGLVTISQSVTDFLATASGRAVLANAALKLLMKQDGGSVDQLVALFDLTAEERQLLLAAGKGEALLLAGGARVPLQVEASPAEHRLVTTAPAEVAALDALDARDAPDARQP